MAKKKKKDWTVFYAISLFGVLLGIREIMKGKS